MSSERKVLVFGTFDGVHEGHLAFLRQARTYADGTKGSPSTSSGTKNIHLVAAVARDEVVEKLKGRKPQQDSRFRIKELEESDLVDEVIEGDLDLGSWGVIGKVKPDVIALGYDQVGLKDALERHIQEKGLKIEVVVMGAYEPEKFHSSLLNR